jgi:hypothetical protein
MTIEVEGEGALQIDVLDRSRRDVLQELRWMSGGICVHEAPHGVPPGLLRKVTVGAQPLATQEVNWVCESPKLYLPLMAVCMCILQ